MNSNPSVPKLSKLHWIPYSLQIHYSGAHCSFEDYAFTSSSSNLWIFTRTVSLLISRAKQLLWVMVTSNFEVSSGIILRKMDYFGTLPVTQTRLVFSPCHLIHAFSTNALCFYPGPPKKSIGTTVFFHKEIVVKWMHFAKRLLAAKYASARKCVILLGNWVYVYRE